MKIDSAMIQYVAALAKLELDEAGEAGAKEDLEKILGYMETMNEADTEGVEPLTHILTLENVFREDEPVRGTDRELLLCNAPRQKDGCFVVQKTVL